MLPNLLLLLFRFKEYVLRYIRRYIISKSAKCVSPPKIIGKIYLCGSNILIGSNVTIYPGVYLWGTNIKIGNNVDLGIGTIIHSTNGVDIGDNTVIAGQCYIIDSKYGTSASELIRNQTNDAAPDGINIGSDVWIGVQCLILKGARIGNGAVIGANSLVNSEIPPNAIAYGSPARVKDY